jgi:hypothetical protein
MVGWRKISVALFVLFLVSLTERQAIAANPAVSGIGGASTTEPSSESSPTPVPGIYGDETYDQLNLVADLGADPTGRTDSTAAVQGFVSAIKNGFGGVIPPGIYSLSNTIEIQGRNSIRFAGLGGGVMGATIFRWDGASGGTVFALNGVADSYFQHLSIRGGSGSVGVCFDVTDGSSDRFVDIGCEGSSIAAFQFSNTSGTAGFDRIEHFAINCSGGDGIQILSSSSIGHDFVDGTIANCAAGIDATSGAFLAEDLSFSSNQTDVHLGAQNGSTGLYTPQSVGAGQFLAVDATDSLPIKIEGGQISTGANQSGSVISDAGSGPLVLSNNWFVSTSSIDNLQILVAPSNGSAISIGNVYPGSFPVVGQASSSSLGDVSTTLGLLPAKLGATIVQTPVATPTATSTQLPVTATPTATETATATSTLTPTATATGTSTPSGTATATRTATQTATETSTLRPTPTMTPVVQPALTLRPTSMGFADTAVKAKSRPKTLLATNTAKVAISLKAAQLTGDFHRSGGTCGSILGTHKHCTYRIFFAPITVGPGLGKFTVSNGGSSEPQTVRLSGVGLPSSPQK